MKTGLVTPRRPALLMPPADTPLTDAQGVMRREWYEFFARVQSRLGVTKDRVADAERLSAAAAGAASAVSSGAASTPFTLDPANPITGVATSAELFTAQIAAHTRTEGGAPTAQPAGSVAGLLRGVAHTVFYDTLGVYQATATAPDFTVAGRKFVGMAFVEADSRDGASFGDGGGIITP